MRRSAATAICWPIWCGGCWRTAPIRPSWRSPPTMPCRWRRCCAVRPTSSAPPTNARHPNIPPAARSLPAAADEFARHRIRRARGVERSGRGGRGEPARTPVRSLTLDPEAASDAAWSPRAPDFKAWSRTPAESRAAILEQAADLLEQRARAFHRAAAARGRQDARRCALGSPRGRRFLPLLCRRGPQTVRRGRNHAGPDRREQCAAAARPRRVRRDIAVEFSAGDLPRPGHGGADGRQ